MGKRGRRAKPLTDRLMSKTTLQPDGCVVFTGTKAGRGYGQMWVTRPEGGSYKEYAHRIAWQLYCGPIPDGLQVLHHCDNRRCVRVDHLFLGTNNDNRADSVMKQRHARGERQGHAKLTESDVCVIRARYAAGVTIATISKDYSQVNRSSIEHIVHGRTWRHVWAN